MLLTIVILLAVAIGALLAYASTKPDDFRTERSALMMAPPATIFAEVNDLRKWYNWSPWAKLDPACKNTFEGPESGVGAAFAWDGNNKVGAGKMTIIESIPGELVRLRLEFFKPFKGTNTSDFTFKPEGHQTRVTWSMYGPNTIPGKVMSLFMDCDKMIGDMYDKGLASLKHIVERK